MVKTLLGVYEPVYKKICIHLLLFMYYLFDAYLLQVSQQEIHLNEDSSKLGFINLSPCSMTVNEPFTRAGILYGEVTKLSVCRRLNVLAVLQ